ncbi:hypothetical protein JG688_00011289 [Phytophthora aleatoria]|uniref:Uncharacterized protein n=1 Tax=Phytophthora aleatoria TaxID=2496075 RepID=A0A8J5IH19_9STRA|nr:hypothetical protein JG688_00011289 [Phytophthora aleatoria]
MLPLLTQRFKRIHVLTFSPAKPPRGRVTKANPRGEPAKQSRAVFAEAGPAPSSSASRALHSPVHTIFISRA